MLFDQDSDWENMTPEEFKAALELAKNRQMRVALMQIMQKSSLRS